MKAFLCATLVFVIMTGLIILNSAFTSTYSAEMTRIAETFPAESIEGAQSTLNSFNNYFSEKEFLIMTTNNHTKVHEIHRSISQIQAAILSNDFSLYTQARLELYEAIRVLSEFNKFSLSEIF